MINIPSNSALFFLNSAKLNSLSFRSSFMVNTEAIEPNLNNKCVNKYGERQCRMKNYE